MSTLAYGDYYKPSWDCALDPPELCGCEPVCEPECRCTPRNNKTRARDAILLSRHEVERWFSLTEWGCSSKPIPATINCIELVVRRKGWCRDLMCLTPVRSTPEAAVQFQWPRWFLEEKHGYYEADLIINGVEQNSILLKLPKRSSVVSDSDGVQSNFPCIDPCAVKGSSCYAVPDGEPATEDYEGCETGCETC